jgi:hypothetical protein
MVDATMMIRTASAIDTMIRTALGSLFDSSRFDLIGALSSALVLGLETATQLISNLPKPTNQANKQKDACNCKT